MALYIYILLWNLYIDRRKGKHYSALLTRGRIHGIQGAVWIEGKSREFWRKAIPAERKGDMRLEQRLPTVLRKENYMHAKCKNQKIHSNRREQREHCARSLLDSPVTAFLPPAAAFSRHGLIPSHTRARGGTRRPPPRTDDESATSKCIWGTKTSSTPSVYSTRTRSWHSPI